MRLSGQAKDRLGELADGRGTRKILAVDQELRRQGLALLDYKRCLAHVTARGQRIASEVAAQVDVGRQVVEAINQRRLEDLPPPPRIDDPIDGEIEEEDEDLRPFTSKAEDNVDVPVCDACGREGCNLEWCLECAETTREIVHLECCEEHRKETEPRRRK